MKKKNVLIVIGASITALVLAVVFITAMVGGDKESTAAEPTASTSPSASSKPSPTATPASEPAPEPSASPSATQLPPELPAPPPAPPELPAEQPGIVTGLQCVTIRHTGPSTSQLFANLQEVWASPEKAWNCEAVYGTGHVNDAEGAALIALDPNAQSPYGLTDLYAICATDNDAVLATVSTRYSPAHAAAALVLCPGHPKAALIQ